MIPLWLEAFTGSEECFESDDGPNCVEALAPILLVSCHIVRCDTGSGRQGLDIVSLGTADSTRKMQRETETSADARQVQQLDVFGVGGHWPVDHLSRCSISTAAASALFPLGQQCHVYKQNI